MVIEGNAVLVVLQGDLSVQGKILVRIKNDLVENEGDYFWVQAQYSGLKSHQSFIGGKPKVLTMLFDLVDLV